MRGYSVSPRVSPVCGGAVLSIEGVDTTLIDEQNITVLVCIEGSRQRHICTTYRHTILQHETPAAKERSLYTIYCCSIPEHEPAESCKLFLVFYTAAQKTIETIPLGTFLYRTDQTQLLAVYLAQSVDDLESLEDWDEIRGEGFSLCSEDFEDLDHRLTAAFQHLLLPQDWSLLGNHPNQPTRETLYHFCARLGLTRFLRYLFTKPGSAMCLSIPNRHGELPQELAQRRDQDELYQVLTDEDTVSRYALQIPETIELENGGCLRHTERNTVNIDVDISDEVTWRPLSDDILLFSEALTQNTHYDKPTRHAVGGILQEYSLDNKLESMGDPLKTIKKINEQIEASIVANNQEKISRRTSQVTLHLSDSRSNSCPDINDQINEINTEQVKLRQKKSCDDFEVMPDAKRRSIIASHVSESLGNQDQRRRSWHESEHSLDRVPDSATFIPRSRSYEHIDEPDLSDNEDVSNMSPIIVSREKDIVEIDREIINVTKRRNSTQTERRPAIILDHGTDRRSPRGDKRQKSAPTREQEERLLDVRAHEVPKKLSESSSSSHSSSALRKGSMATLFKSLSGQIQNPRRGRARSETKAARLMRSKASEDPKMAVIHSDTDTDTDNKRFGSRSLDRSRVKRNESNSSADYLSRNNSHKSEKPGSQADSVDSDSSCPSDFEDDAELNAPELADTWYAYTNQKQNPAPGVDKAEIKRQENIYEIIHTENNHHRTLLIMQKIFVGRMRAELRYRREKCARFFPDLDELELISREFLKRLRKRQAEQFPVVTNIADVLNDFWNSEWGERKARAYGQLCAHQHESLRLYKEELRTNKSFNNLMKKVKTHKLTKRLDIPDCIQMVTSRLTKYPLLLDTVIKNTKNDATEKSATLDALDVIKKIAQSVDGQMEEHKRKLKFDEIISTLDRSSVTKFKEKRFGRKELNLRRMESHFDLILTKDKTKSHDATLLIMEDVLVLLSSKNGKYSFFGENNAVLALQSCHLSQNAQDPQSIFIVGESDEWHKWDLKAPDKHQARKMTDQINLAKHCAPRGVGGVEKRRQDEKRYEEMRARARAIHQEDRATQDKINSLLSEQIERQKDFLHWAAGKNTQLGDSIEHQLDLIEANKEGHEYANELFDRLVDNTERLKTTSSSTSKDDSTKIHKAETFNGFDSSSSKSSSSPPNDSTTTLASEMAMTITKLRKQYAALLEHQNELNGKLLLANQYAGFRGSRGVLEAEQARLQRLFSDQRKELDEERIMTEEERRKVELDKISIDSKMKKIDEREAMINMSEKDLRKKWDEYQQNALALRNTRNRIPESMPASSGASVSSVSSNSTVEHRNSGSNLTRDPSFHDRSSRDTSLNSSHHSATSLHRAPKKSSEKNQRRIEHHPARKPDQQNLPTHLKFSAVNQLQTGSGERASMRSLNSSSNGSSKALIDLAANSQLPTKLATSTSRGKLKKI